MTEYSTIANEVDRINTNIENTYTALQAKGATIPVTKNTDNLSSCISTVVIPPLVPCNCAGLCFWLDGDCNTRQGLDRSKKYMENLVWNVPVTTTTGNREIFSTNTSIWHDNILELKTYFKYPLISSDTLTIELVAVKIAGSVQFSSSFASVSNFVFKFFKDHSDLALRLGSAYEHFNSSSYLQSDLGVVHYIVYTHNANKKQVKLYNPADAITDTFTYTKTYVSPSSLYDCGFGTGSGTDSVDTYSGTGIGMCRIWNRILTSDEIQANYIDAKRRFNCI